MTGRMGHRLVSLFYPVRVPRPKGGYSDGRRKQSIPAEADASVVPISPQIQKHSLGNNLLPAFAMLLGAVFEFSDNPSAQGILEGIVLGAVTTGSYGVVKGAAQSVLPTKKKTFTDYMDADDDRCA